MRFGQCSQKLKYLVVGHLVSVQCTADISTSEWVGGTGVLSLYLPVPYMPKGVSLFEKNVQMEVLMEHK